MARRAVVQSVRTSKGAAAAVAACVVLCGCVSGEASDQTTTSPAGTEVASNPWDLPIEQRPALFDPCTEIPVQAIEQGVGGPVEPDERLTNHRPGELMTCGWTNRKVQFNAIGTWKSRSEYLADPGFVLKEDGAVIAGRKSLRMAEVGDGTDRTCLHLFFTNRGTVYLKLDLVGGLSEFRGVRFSKACDALDQAIEPVVSYIPEGDF